MADTYEMVLVTVKPHGESYNNSYQVTFESATPSFHARQVAEAIHKLLKAEFVAEGLRNIRYKGKGE